MSPPPIPEPHVEAIRELDAAFISLGVIGVIIGGVAVAYLASPRFTEDVDAMILFDNRELTRLLHALEPYGFKGRFRDMHEFARGNIVPLRHEPTGVTVDIALGCTPFEEEILQRSQIYRDADFAVRLPSPEDLVIMKAIANRDQDRLDIRKIAAVYPNLDKSRIKWWVNEYSELLYIPDLWSQIEPLLSME